MASAADFIEVDFLGVETAKSGDAIPIRYTWNGHTYIHVVDGGFLDMGEKIKEHIDTHYTSQDYIDHVVLSHPDQDHANGLRYILENCDVQNLWMNRPWLYATELLPRFKSYTNANNLADRLRECFPSAAALEEIALEKNIPILEAFQGSAIGLFRVMAPSRARFLDLVVESEKTPAAATPAVAVTKGLLEALTGVAKAAVNFVKAAWGAEVFSDQPTSRQNEMSVVQYADFNGTKFLLTADAGREALTEVIGYAPYVGLALPGIDRFQVPHHGSRRNVSTDILNALLGPVVPNGTSSNSYAYISSAKADPDHPRKAVVRAMHHRGLKVMATEGNSLRSGVNAPQRVGWGPIDGLPYPDEQEE